MDDINLNIFLNRTETETKIKEILLKFGENKHNLLFKKGIYIYGNPGSGKTQFITNILKNMNYDIITYDAGDIRSMAIIENIAKNNVSDTNIMSIFKNNAKKIAIIMDEIDGMNSGDKGGINSLITLIRPKKTKKQKLEDSASTPIICIGNYRIDKKIKELMKVCNTFELTTPSDAQISTIVNNIMPAISNDLVVNNILPVVQGDLKKLNTIYTLYIHKPNLFKSDNINDLFQIKSYNDDTKKITSKLLNEYYSIDKHNTIMSDPDRTSVGLLWHENIIDNIEQFDKKITVPFYISQLNNICFSDYIDRITFQKQIWQFNEMSSLIKTLKNNKLYHDTFKNAIKVNDVRFTKVLTKYSTEYNNSLFIQKMCQNLGMDKNDMFGLFINLIKSHNIMEINNMLERFEINKLDISRIYRYIEKYIKFDATGTIDNDYDDTDISDE